MTEEILLKNCKYIATMNGKVLCGEDVLICDGEIEAIGEHLRKTGIVVDCSDKVVMPGLVNCHTHAAMVLFRGYYDDAELDEWLRKIWIAEARLEPRIVYLASKLAIYEMLSSGITTFIDMYFYPEEAAKAAVEAGVRAALGPVFADNFYDPREVLRELEEFYKKYGNLSLVKPIVNVYSIYTCSEETLLMAKEFSDNRNADVYMHVSETRREVYECRKKHGVFPVEYLDRLGLLSSRLRLIRLGWVTSWEIELIKRKKASIIYCPTSSMKLATAGFFPFKEAVRSGVTVGLGTDGAATNNCLDMFREMKYTVLLQRNNYWDAEVNAGDALHAATVNGGKIIREKIGKIAEGYTADLTLIDANSIHLQPLRKDNLLSSLVYSATGADVATTIVNGKIVYNRENLLKIKRKIQEITQKLNAFIEKISKTTR